MALGERISQEHPEALDALLIRVARARMRTIVKRLLRKHGYPPDKQDQAVRTILEQTEALCKDLAA